MAVIPLLISQLARACCISVFLALAACGVDVEPRRDNGPAAWVPMGQLGSDGVVFTVDAPDGIARLVAQFKAFAGAGIRVHHLSHMPDTNLLLLVVDQSQFEPLIVGRTGDSKKGISAASQRKKSDLSAIVGSSFVSEVHTFEPVGLLQINDELISPVQPHGYTRILGVGPKGLGVVDHRTYERGLFISAFQAGPGVIEEGKLDIAPRDQERPRYFRTFAATCQGQIIMGASLIPMNLYTLGKALTEFFSAQPLACDEVVNLAGDRQVLLAIIDPNRSDMVYVGDPRSRKAAILGVRRRASPGGE